MLGAAVLPRRMRVGDERCEGRGLESGPKRTPRRRGESVQDPHELVIGDGAGRDVRKMGADAGGHQRPRPLPWRRGVAQQREHRQGHSHQSRPENRCGPRFWQSFSEEDVHDPERRTVAPPKQQTSGRLLRGPEVRQVQHVQDDLPGHHSIVIIHRLETAGSPPRPSFHRVDRCHRRCGHSARDDAAEQDPRRCAGAVVGHHPTTIKLVGQMTVRRCCRAKRDHPTVTQRSSPQPAGSNRMADTLNTGSC